MLPPSLKSRTKPISQQRSSVQEFSKSRSSFLAVVFSLPFAGLMLCAFALFPLAEIATPASEAAASSTVSFEPSGSRIKEAIPDRFAKRYQKWKAEYLSTAAGREQWQRYARNENFTLMITVSAESGKGAGTDQYRWDDKGQLVAATITLGAELDEGYPSPFNYPVTSSLAHAEPAAPIGGSVLAATKLAHEFGHVNRAAKTDAQLYQLQNKLIPVYNRIFLSNGVNVRDPKLVELAKQMKGTPVQIGRDRELWAEANALVYLRERYPEDGTYKPVFKAIQRAVEEYSQDHIERFR